MQLSMNTYTPSFKAFMITPSGEKAIDNYDTNKKGLFKESFSSYIYRQKKKRENDKYVDTIITGEPDQLGYYNPVLCIKDKVTGKHYRGSYSGEYPYKYFVGDIDDTNRKIPLTIKDSKNQDIDLSFDSVRNAFQFVSYLEAPNYAGSDNINDIDILKFKVVGYLEDKYRKLFGDDGSKSEYDEFISKFNLEYNSSVDTVVPNIMNENNLLGRGRQKDVYKIPKMPDYVFCVLRDKYDSTKPITPFHECKPVKLNNISDKDEPILVNDNGMYIKKYTKGKSHSLPNWFDKYHNIEPLTYDDVELFKSELEDLSSFPTKSYVDFAKELQQMNRKRIRIDTINPNNILIDSDMQTINVIDTQDADNTITHLLWHPVNGLSDMEAILLDSIMYTKYYEMATDEDKEKLDEYAKAIIKKCDIAAKVSNLGNSPRNTVTYVSDVDEYLPLKEGGTRRERLEAFKEHFDGVLSDKIVSSQNDAMERIMAS